MTKKYIERGEIPDVSTTVYVVLPASVTRKMDYNEICDMLEMPAVPSYSAYDCQPWHGSTIVRKGKFKTLAYYHHGIC